MNYNNLRYFYTVAKTLNITKAAEQLYISQPVLSRHISDLEKELKGQLFIRTNKNLILTKAGQLLYDECAPFFSKEQKLYRIVREAVAEGGGRLTISSMGTSLSYKLPALIQRFQARYPNVELHMQRRNWRTVLKDVESGEADIGIKMRIDELYPDKIERYVLTQTNLALIVPVSHRFANAGEITLEMIQDEPLIEIANDPSSKNNEHMFREAGLRYNVAATHPNVETVMLMVQSGAGVAISSRLAPIEGLHGIQCIPIADELPVFMDAIWRRDSQNGEIQNFLELLIEEKW